MEDQNTGIGGSDTDTGVGQLAPYPPEWRLRIEAEIAGHLTRGKTPKHIPATDEEWEALYAEFPSSLLASWFTLTGRKVAS